MTEAFTPKLVALDIDGTLYANVPSTGAVAEVISPAVKEAVDGAVEAGAHIVLSTGRSAFSITEVWEQLGLPRDGDGQVLTVASNGSVVFSYPPVDVLSMVTFDAREIVTMLLEHVPQAAVAVEEIGVGYRLNDHFPGGDLTGEMIIEDLEQLSARPVTRVILRDPTRSDSDFISLARHLGLHGVTYFVGWSAWLDIAPEGVNKATALAEVAEGLGVTAADVLAFGDGRNDTEMLRWAGRGLAIGDAPDEVKAAADDVTARFGDGGPIAELRRYF